MTFKPLLSLVLLASFPLLLVAQDSPEPPVPASAQPKAPCDQPAASETNSRFLELHNSFLDRAKAGPIGALFLGDSITERWNKASETWNEYFGKYQPANFGISGDKTEGVLWRIAHGELDGIHPKVVVLMIGTNNTTYYSAPEITSGVKAVVQQIQVKLPKTKILLLGIFPRGPRTSKGTTDDGVARMEKIRVINPELAKLEDGSTIRYLDISDKFLNAEGKIPSGLMPDQLHPSPEGYKVWAEAMQPLLDSMMTEKNP